MGYAMRTVRRWRSVLRTALGWKTGFPKNLKFKIFTDNGGNEGARDAMYKKAKN